MGRILKKKELKEACRRIQVQWIDSIQQDLTEMTEEPSKNLERILRDMVPNEEKIRARRNHRRAVSIILTIICMFFLWLALDEKSRTAILGGNGSAGSFGYPYMESKEDSSVFKIVPAWLPDGLKLIQEEWTRYLYAGLYLDSQDEERGLLLYVGQVKGDGFLSDLSNQSSNVMPISVQGEELSYYYSENEEKKNYLWVDEDFGIFICINSSLEHEQNIRIWKELFDQRSNTKNTKQS